MPAAYKRSFPFTILGLLLMVLILSGCESAEMIDADADGNSDTNTIDIYFSSNRTGNFEIYRKQDEQLTALTNNPQYDSWWPRQSPDGRTMLFYRSLITDRPETGGHNNNYDDASLWSLDLISGITSELIAKNGNGWSSQGVVDWSPDGSKLLMAAVDANTNLWNLYVTDTAGQNPVKISQRASLYLDPSWSPFGDQITYVAYPDEYFGFDLSRLEVFTANADGSNETRLTNDTLRDHDPYWSPDGAQIAFETAVDPDYVGVGKWALRTIELNTSLVSTLLDDGNINTLPRWSRDGSTLYFHRFVFGGEGQFRLASINTDGSNLVTLTATGAYDDTDVDWFR